MRLKPHRRFSQFQTWFEKRLSVAAEFSETVYRVAGPRYTTAAEIISGVGATKGGGRWNPPGAMKVVYASRKPETALAEALEHYRYYHLPEFEAMPKVVVALSLKFPALLDLTVRATRDDLPVTMTDLLAEDWRAMQDRGREAISQAMGRAAYDAGWQGLIVPSRAAKGGMNVIVFPERLTRSCRLKVLNPHVLAKLGKRD